MRLIDADKAYKILTEYYHHKTDIQHEALKEALSKVPTVDAEPVRHGYWINKGYYAICSECGANSGTQYNGLEPIPNWSRYCSDCGAKMYESKEQSKGETKERGEDG